MAPYQLILVPIVFSARDEQALEHLERLATPGETRVRLLHVVEALPHSQDDPLVGFYRSLEENARHKLTRLAKELSERGYAVDISVALGRPATKIVEESQTSGADLLVMSSHPIGTGHPETEHWATASYQAAIMCRCPVLLVK